MICTKYIIKMNLFNDKNNNDQINNKEVKNRNH